MIIAYDTKTKTERQEVATTLLVAAEAEEKSWPCE